MLRWFLLMIISIVSTILLFPLLLIFQAIRIKFIFKKDVTRLFMAVALSLDQLGGAIIYLDEDTTISFNTYKYAHIKNNRFALYFERFIDAIFYKGHCKESYINEVEK